MKPITKSIFSLKHLYIFVLAFALLTPTISVKAGHSYTQTEQTQKKAQAKQNRQQQTNQQQAIQNRQQRTNQQQSAINRQQNNKKVQQGKKKQKRIINTAIREEIQRYIGYEALPIRYISLPYDASMNTNVHGAFVDIGFLLLLFIPIILLLGFAKKPLLGSLTMGLCLLMLIVSVATPYLMLTPQTEPATVIQALDKFLAENSFSQEPVRVTTSYINKVIFQVKKPIHSFVNSVSGEKDHFTYPFLMLFFTGIFFLLQARIKKQSTINRAMINLLYLFGFLSLLLTAGIIWYSLLFFAVAILIVTAKMMDQKKQKTILSKLSFGVFVAATILWIGMAYLYRLSNNRMPNEQNAINLFDSSIARFQTGALNKKEAINALYPNSDKAFALINSEDESLVYKVGTTLSFLVKKNDKRVFHDNQLGSFQQLINRYPDKAVLTEVFKASGYKYFLIDLKTHTLDKTPEQSLKKKFNQLMGFLYQNSGLQLLGTNQVVEKADGTREYNVFGNVKFEGNYAIFQIK